MEYGIVCELNCYGKQTSISSVDVGLMVVTPCGLVGGYQRFEGTYCLLLQGCPADGVCLTKPELTCKLLLNRLCL
jgi:hypothetical protein